MRTCLLCNKPADSKEHYIPVWLSEATGKGMSPIMIGSASEGKILHQADRGTARTAKHRNLCTKCNNDLGRNLEGRVRPLLSPLVASAPAEEWTAYLNGLLARERDLVAWWTALRAVQLNEQFTNPRIPAEARDGLLADLRRVRDGQIPALPKCFFVEIAQASEPDWGFSLSRQLYDRFRGRTVERPSSFLWAMQANQCLLVAASAPDAQLLKDCGWGYGIVPQDGQKCPRYKNMREMLERSHIDTRLPKIYEMRIGRQSFGQ